MSSAEVSESTLSMDTVPVQCEEYSLRKTACCFILVDEDNKSVLKLNQTSALIWELCTGEWSIEDMVDVLSESFPEAGEAISDDVFRVLDQFVEESVINTDSPT